MNCDANIKLVGMNVDDYSSSESESESETSENQESATTSTVTSTSCPSLKKRKRPKRYLKGCFSDVLLLKSSFVNIQFIFYLI